MVVVHDDFFWISYTGTLWVLNPRTYPPSHYKEENVSNELELIGIWQSIVDDELYDKDDLYLPSSLVHRENGFF